MIHAAPPLSRRRFASALGTALGAAALRPSLAAAAPVPAGAVTIDLSSNENPYGPSPAALAALTRSQAVAGRYPDAAEKEATEAIARLHGVSPDCVVLGCGSSDILRLCDGAFLGRTHGRRGRAHLRGGAALRDGDEGGGGQGAAHGRLPARPPGHGPGLRRPHRARLRLQPQQPRRARS